MSLWRLRKLYSTEELQKLHRVLDRKNRLSFIMMPIDFATLGELPYYN